METTSSHSRFTASQKWTLASTSAGFALEHMDVMFLSFALASIIATLHITGAQAGLISSISNLGTLIGGLGFGLIADHYGRIKVFTYTIFIFAFATAAMAVANNLALLYLFRFLSGVGSGGEYGVGITLIAENFPARQLGKLSSLAAIGGQCGAILAAIAAALIIPSLGWHALFVFGLVPVALIYFIRRHLHESDAFKSAQRARKPVQLRRLFATPRLTHQTCALMVMTTVQIAGYYGLMNWLPSIMQKRLGLTVAGSSGWMIVTILGMSLGMLVFGHVLDHFGPRLAFGLFLLAAAVALFGILLTTNRLTLFLAGATLGFFSDGMYGGYGAIVSRLYPTEIRTTANNFIVNVGRLIGGFSSVVIGFLMDHGTLLMVMSFLAILYLISLAAMLSIPNLRRLAPVTR
ncbi:MFS transporter [Levilactobacillus acidifarinae]|uniref:Major facilitator superfamily permease n=1 Tax=Levilactobacillus acidifarinae DSM 19394 = JCM 15949 TaxID=1423715 RepID=A0A0R1LJV8_9LACO|nr:MFS transporter [Levilactobacillus acidifarinae]KRK96069.1 major facilitator superfamily permease [Levilactobacillus acidifarinae DSM 19394]GEO69657.1 MFS transporter [Levilactobacillus acidifarinae]